MDADGCLYIVERKKDMFISGGENIYPTEIEAVLYGHPAVFQCAVIGVPDPEWGEVGKACIVPQPGSEPTESEILDYLRAHLARYKIPKSVVFVDTLPRTAAGKVLKRVDKDGYSGIRGEQIVDRLPPQPVRIGDQWFCPHEIIVADNGSDDGTGEIARRCGARVVREERRGYGWACLAAAGWKLLP